MNKKQRRWRNRILVAIALFFAIMLAEKLGLWNALFGSYATYGEFALYLIPYLIAVLVAIAVFGLRERWIS